MRAINILVDPAVDIEMVRRSLGRAALNLTQSETSESLYVLRPAEIGPNDDTVRVPVLRQAG